MNSLHTIGTKSSKGDFRSRVLAVVRRIPHGSVMTYAAVAADAGSPHAYRAVGSILGKNYNLAIPCHRVIRSDGSPGGYNRGLDQKINLLKSEKTIDQNFTRVK